MDWKHVQGFIANEVGHQTQEVWLQGLINVINYPFCFLRIGGLGQFYLHFQTQIYPHTAIKKQLISINTWIKIMTLTMKNYISDY